MSGPCPVQLGRVMHPEKLAAKRFVTNFLRVKINQNGLGVAGGMGADFLVGRIFGVSASIADCRFGDAGTWSK